MTARHFEVVIVGGTAPAVVLAALLAKRGLRGLLVDQGELVAEGALELDLGLADDGSAVMELVHAELGIGLDLRRRMKPADPPLQIILPDQRIDLPPDRAALEVELRRAFGTSAAEAMLPLLGELAALDEEASVLLAEAGPLPPRGFFARRHAAQIARRHARLTGALSATGWFEGPKTELARILLGLLPFATHLDATEPQGVSLLRFVRPLSRLMRGVHRSDPGTREMLLDLAKRSGFEVLKSAVERAEPKGALVRLGFVRDTSVITTDCLIDASSDLSGLGTIPLKSRPRGVAELLGDGTPKGHLHALEVEVDRGVIPPGMGDHVLLLNGRRDTRPSPSGDPEADDRPILLLRRAPAPKSERVRLLALHPLSATWAHASGTTRLEAAMQARIERFIPFLPDGKPELRGAGQLGGDHRGPIHPLFDPETDPLTGVSGVTMQTPYKNVFVAGPQVLPGLGIEGAYLTALEAAEDVEALLGRKKKVPLAARLGSSSAARTRRA